MKSLEITKLENKIEEIKKTLEPGITTDELENLENSSKFWITTPSLEKMRWGSSQAKFNWTDEHGVEFDYEVKLNDKVVKLGNDWFKIVKLNTLPNWLAERERETK